MAEETEQHDIDLEDSYQKLSDAFALADDIPDNNTALPGEYDSVVSVTVTKTKPKVSPKPNITPKPKY